MTDINEWNISYTRLNGFGQNFDFGSWAAGSKVPFTAQVAFGDADTANNDQAHGFEDAVFQGRDQVLATDVTFKVSTLPTTDATKIDDALDAMSEFEAVWRADGLRRVPGNYALLTNKRRNKYVRGRPRNFSRVDSDLRRGIVSAVAQFRTVTPYWYALPQNEAIPPRTVSTAQAIGGDVMTWPIIEFTGQFDTASLTWTPGFLLPPWTMTINTPLANGDIIYVDCRPDVRSAYDVVGVFKNGALAGSPMSDCFMYPDHPSYPAGGHFLFTTTGTTSAATKCRINWYDTYAGL